ncbi:cell division protein ZapA [Marinobacterium sedimentorum]|uniref:cell division protein ZapA n=1 Tax=Marinobacterium sedimentorum TaxID=2927804 RepID=UPI0020C609BD|nr:cell division protein ZapA [Marinobacterium sedimentorum]MCP8688946.1 cell division protein ZapA [Marinobacterium sedimentorum]
MSKTEAHKVTIKLLDKEYMIACPEGAEAELLTSADYLDQKMRDIRGNGKTVGLERVAVMAALNIAHELLRSHADNQQHIEDQVRHLGSKIDQSLSRSKLENRESGD